VAERLEPRPGPAQQDGVVGCRWVEPGSPRAAVTSAPTV